MTEQAERHLRELFAEPRPDGERAERLATAALQRAGRRRRARLGWSLCCACLVGGVATAVVRSGGDTRTHTAAGSRTSVPRAVIPAGSAPSCVASYSPAALTRMAFAFDGTVTALGAARTNRAGRGRLPLVSARFTVHEWFRGGTSATVGVDVARPTPGVEDGASVPDYAVGTRLLVSGMPRWGGAPLADPIAWACGFTRRYDAATAAAWRAALRAQ